MANHRPKGVEYMRELGSRGGLKSGETRRLNAAVRIIEEYGRRKRGIETPAAGSDRKQAVAHEVWAATGRRFTLDEIAEAMRPVNRRGGSHDLDWRCPHCRRFNSIRRESCARCFRAPQNGRWTRAALRESAAEHRNAGLF